MAIEAKRKVQLLLPQDRHKKRHNVFVETDKDPQKAGDHFEPRQ